MTAPDLTGISPAETRALYQKAREAGEAGYVDKPRLITDKEGSRSAWWEAQFRIDNVDGREVVFIVSREVSRRVLAEQAATRIRKIYATLSATNEAIMRLSSPQELFQAVCDAAIESGGLTTAAILMPWPGSHIMEVKAMAGIGREVLMDTVMSVDPDVPEGRGLTGTAFRSGEPAVSNNYFVDPRTAPWRTMMRDRTLLKAVASIPIVLDGKSIGTMHLCSRERNAFDEEIVGLLTRMADNIAFALHTFEVEEARRQTEEKAHYLATHCSLTGLPNRNLLSDLLDQAIVSANRTAHNPAIMFVDLDNFKQINDTWGHDAGDRVLEQVAGRLRTALREHDVLARLGGDEFVVLVQDIDRREHAQRVAEKLLAVAQDPVTVEGESIQITLSIGVSLYPLHGKDQKQLMKAADLAMYKAKEQGKNTWALAGECRSEQSSV